MDGSVLVQKAGPGNGGTAGEYDCRGEGLGDLKEVVWKGVGGESMDHEVRVGGARGEGERVEEGCFRWEGWG